jgi:hypothetical protein
MKVEKAERGKVVASWGLRSGFTFLNHIMDRKAQGR